MFTQTVAPNAWRPHSWPVGYVMSRLETAVSIRRAVKKDAAIMADIGRYGFAATHRLAFLKADLALYLAQTFGRQQILAEMAQPDTQFLVAEVAGEVVGTLRLTQHAPASVRLTEAVELSRLYLHPDAVGCGVGSALMLRALGTAVASGAKNCWLGVWQGNGRAINFYQKWGFETVGIDVILVGQSCPVGLIMSRSL